MLGRIHVSNSVAASRRSSPLAFRRDSRTWRLVFLNRIAQDDLIQTEDLIADLDTNSSEQHPSLPFIPAFNIGDIVYGTTTFSNERGVRVDIMYHQGLVGYMPVDQSPLRPEEWSKTSPGAQSMRLQKRAVRGSEGGHGGWDDSSSQLRSKLTPHHAHSIPLGRHMRMVQGHTRPFKVIAIPPIMQLNGRGPLLSAFKYDRDMLWARVSQFYEAMQDTIPFSLKITSSNTGGLIGTLMGLEVFVPNSHICKRDGMNLEQAAEHLMGQEIEVVFIGMEPFKSIKASETKAWDLRHQPKTGQIVWGVVKKIMPNCAFIRLDGRDLDGALFRHAISSDVPDHVSQALAVGQRICAAVSETLEDGRVRLSTRVLEHAGGEMRSAAGMQAVMERAMAGPMFVEVPDAERHWDRATGRGDGRMTEGSSPSHKGTWEADGSSRHQSRSGSEWKPSRQSSSEQWGFERREEPSGSGQKHAVERGNRGRESRSGRERR